MRLCQRVYKASRVRISPVTIGPKRSTRSRKLDDIVWCIEETKRVLVHLNRLI